MTTLILFLLGLAAGSFLNVLSLRYKEGAKLFSLEILTGRSRCPYCGKTLTWYELIPILSYLAQFGKCRACKHPLSIQYPVVELLSGLTFIFIPQFVEPAPVGILVVLTLILITLIDLRLSIIPNELTGFLAVLGIFTIVFFPAHQSIFYKIIGAVFALALFGLIIFLTKGRGMGMGDLKLAGALGLLFGWPKIVLILMAAFIIGGFWSAIILIAKKKSLKDSIPFGPFLSLAALLIILFDDYLVNLLP